MARTASHRWNDWRVSLDGRNIKSDPKKDAPSPTAKQLVFLKSLRADRGAKGPTPKTRRAASKAIEREIELKKVASR